MSRPIRRPAVAPRQSRVRVLLVAGLALTAFAACGAGAPGSAPASAVGSSGAATTGAPATTAPAPPTSSPTIVALPSTSPSPLGERLVATVDVDPAPCAMASDGHDAWITSARNGTLDRIDGTTAKVTGRVDVGGSLCGVGVTADGTIWVADLGHGRVVAVDPATMKVVHELDGVGPQLWDLKTGFGSVWAVDRNHRTLLRIDPATAAVAATIPIGPVGSGLAVLRDAVWVADEGDGSLRRIDPATNQATVVAKVPGGAIWFQDDGVARLLVSQKRNARVSIVDIASGTVPVAIDGWQTPLDGTVVAGTAWIPDGRAGAIRRVDADTGTVKETLALPGAKNPFVAEPGFGDVWVLDFGGRTVWRIRV